jgi:hypothetical protein
MVGDVVETRRFAGRGALDARRTVPGPGFISIAAVWTGGSVSRSAGGEDAGEAGGVGHSHGGNLRNHHARLLPV